MKQQFRNTTFRGEHSYTLIEHADNILSEYRGTYEITLRGLYYQFVARDLFPESWQDPKTGSTNNQKSYDKLGKLLTDARYAGLIDWDDLRDNTRELTGDHYNYDAPARMLKDYANNYLRDLWQEQDVRLELWFEKDAIEGVAGPAARRFGVPYYSTRGYSSVTAIKDRADEFANIIAGGQGVMILDLRDHDPSGMDMTRDAEERVKEFLGPDLAEGFAVNRIGLNMSQIRRYNPPSNPAKVTDDRAHGPNGYIAKYGTLSWELDALDPKVLDNLISTTIKAAITDAPAYNRQVARQNTGRARIKEIARNWHSVRRYLDQMPTIDEPQKGIGFSNEEPDDEDNDE